MRVRALVRTAECRLEKIEFVVAAPEGALIENAIWHGEVVGEKAIPLQQANLSG
jgi:hypothetical protein